jgi:hypothetical protein
MEEAEDKEAPYQKEFSQSIVQIYKRDPFDIWSS